MAARMPPVEPELLFGLETAVIVVDGRRVHVLDVEGEVDMNTAPRLKRELIMVIEGGGRDVVVDFSGTSFIDSTTLGVLLGALRRLRSVGGSLVIVCADPNIRKIFEITQLARVIRIVDTRDEALGPAGDRR